MGTKEEEILETNANSERRSFLKKAVYSVPVLVALGTLIKPTKTKAERIATKQFGLAIKMKLGERK